jgi:Polysaccharide biosynthesis/export protein
VFADHARASLCFGTPLAAFLLLAACTDSRGGPIPYDQKFAAPDAPSLQTLESNYKIAPKDKLAIKVFKAEDLSGDYDVDLAGHISLPLIGEVDAANLITAELDDRLTQRLGEKYLERPDVSVALTKAPSDSGYGYGRYGYGYAYGQRKVVDRKRTEILMIPQGSES